jgi:hypothetical protein
MESNADLERAASRLDLKLRMKPWYISVGVGETEEGAAIFLYVKSKRHREISDLGNRWLGHRLIVKPVGSIRPATFLNPTVNEEAHAR